MHWRVRRIIDHVWGPTGSVILHFLIVMALVTLVEFHGKTEVDDPITVVMMDPIEPPDFDPTKDFREPPPTDINYDPMTNLTPPDDAVEPPDMPDDETAFQNDLDPANLSVLSDVRGTLILKGLYEGRNSTGIATALGEYGGGYGGETEPAVIRALEWLKAHQNEDGSWGEGMNRGVQARRYTIGLTGLGLLTFLAHGETPSSERYGATVERAIRFLVARQDPESGFFVKIDSSVGADGQNHDNGPYAHALATYAISEAYGLTRIQSLAPVMERAVQPILDGQMPSGAWGYGYLSAKGARKDLSVSGWQIQALKAARIAGAENEGLEEALARAMKGVQIMQVANGRFAYATSNSRPDGDGTDSMTGVGVLCLQMLGEGHSDTAKSGVSALRSIRCDWDGEEWGEGLHRTRSYDYYYITQAAFQAGGGLWKRWNRQVATELTRAQYKEGYWLGPASACDIVNQVYNTTLAALTLEVYYRFLPTYKLVEQKDPTWGDDDDVNIQIVDEEKTPKA